VTSAKDHLRDDLRDRLRRLDELGAEFDAIPGSDTDAAVRVTQAIARHVGTIVDDDETPSLLKALSVKQVLRFVDSTIPYDPRDDATYHGLVTVGTQTGDGPSISWYVPPLAQGSPVRQKNPVRRFDDWWNALVIRDANGAAFSRAEAVHGVAGGDAPTLEWRTESGAQMANSPLGPSVRQVSYEIVETMDRNRRILGFTPKSSVES
jgi:hypothetical protein